MPERRGRSPQQRISHAFDSWGFNYLRIYFSKIPSKGLMLYNYQRKKSADDTGDAVEPFPLTVSTSDRICLRVVHPLRNPAFRAVGKRGRFHKFPAHPEFTAMNAEPAVLKRFLLFRKALDTASHRRQDAVVVFGHNDANLA
jgi:hypothetical protein